MKPANQVYLGKIVQTRLINKWQMIPIRVRLEHERQRTPPRPPASYSYRLTLYLDFLGFKERIRRTVEDDGALDDLCDVIDRIKEIAVGPGITSSEQVTQFSDSIVVSYAIDEPSAVFHLLNGIALATLEVVSRGFLVRGAVTVGKLYHTDDYVFGPALVAAYELESKVAIFPRVLIDPEVLRVASKFRIPINSPEDEVSYVESFLTKDTDGWFFFDYISWDKVMAVGGKESLYPAYLKGIGLMVEAGLSDADAGVRGKYLWLYEHYRLARRLFERLPPSDNYRQANPELVATIVALPTYADLAQAARRRNLRTSSLLRNAARNVVRLLSRTLLGANVFRRFGPDHLDT